MCKWLCFHFYFVDRQEKLNSALELAEIQSTWANCLRLHVFTYHIRISFSMIFFLIRTHFSIIQQWHTRIECVSGISITITSPPTPSCWTYFYQCIPSNFWVFSFCLFWDPLGLITVASQTWAGLIHRSKGYLVATPLKKMSFSPRSHWLPIKPQTEAEHHASVQEHLPPSSGGMLTGPILRISWGSNCSCWVFMCAKGMSCPDDHALQHHSYPPVLPFFPRQIFPRREACISIALLNWDG